MNKYRLRLGSRNCKKVSDVIIHFARCHDYEWFPIVNLKILNFSGIADTGHGSLKRIFVVLKQFQTDDSLYTQVDQCCRRLRARTRAAPERLFAHDA